VGYVRASTLCVGLAYRLIRRLPPANIFAPALGALVSQFQQKGLGNQVNSWIGHGANEPIAPDQVAHALGEENIQALQQQTGAPREALLSELAQHLPDAVHELTPQGRLPDDGELHQIAQSQPGQAPPG
jgi:uncharacterized protein YidB (DUF937 family)